MADILITSERHEDGLHHIEMSSGKKAAYVFWSDNSGQINVCCQNASHKAWRGLGRVVQSWAEAVAAYKSADMRAMVRHAASVAGVEEI